MITVILICVGQGYDDHLDQTCLENKLTVILTFCPLVTNLTLGIMIFSHI